MVRNTGCSCGAPSFSYQHSPRGSQLYRSEVYISFLQRPASASHPHSHSILLGCMRPKAHRAGPSETVNKKTKTNPILPLSHFHQQVATEQKLKVPERAHSGSSQCQKNPKRRRTQNSRGDFTGPQGTAQRLHRG